MKKAFTLVELLAVIIIIGLISLIVVPKVINIIADSKNKAYNNQVDRIEKAANLYVTENPYDVTFTGGKAYVTLSNLIDNGYLEAPIINQKTGESFDLDDTVVEITKTDEKYSFDFLLTGIPPAPSWTFDVLIPHDGDSFIFGASDANLIIDWGDGTETTHVYSGDDYISHVYNEGFHDITLKGEVSHISFCNLGTFNWACNNATPENLWSIKSQIPIEFGITDASNMFSYTNIYNAPEDFFTLASQNVTNMNYMYTYAGGSSSDTFNGISNFNTSNVTSMKYMFSYTLFNEDISGWDTSNVTNMGCMFEGASSFNQNISNWNVSLLENMEYMFADATHFNQNIGSWDTSSVISMRQTFKRATDFNQNIGSWDTSNVTNMQALFTDASSFNQDLSSWCVTSITEIPESFDTGATSWVLSRPIWGTCP